VEPDSLPMTIRQAARKLLIALCAPIVAAILSWSVQASDELWNNVQTGKHLIVVRHALAPGTGDPSDFDVTRCETQRNLSDTGRQQARRIGEMLHSVGLDNVQLYTSQWCRCVETAELMKIGEVEEQPLLNSFFANPSTGPAQMQKLHVWLSELNSSRPTVLVTHQVVISALTDVYPTSGEAVVFEIDGEGNVEVLTRINTEY